MSSSYTSDPSVPPARVEHLGKRRRSSSQEPAGSSSPQAVRPPVDQGPSYDDFLEHRPDTDELPNKTG